MRVPMRGEGTDGLVVAMRSGNTGGAKEPDDLAEGAGQPARGGACGCSSGSSPLHSKRA